MRSWSGRSLRWMLVLLVVPAFVLAASSVAVAQGAASQSTTFRLVTFDAGNGPRLGATEGDHSADIVDIHNAIRYLIATGAPLAEELPYIPADMKQLIEAGDRSISSVRHVYSYITGEASDGDFQDPGGDRRIFYDNTAVQLLPPVPNPDKVFGLAGNFPREGSSPSYPSAFFKSIDALIGHGQTIQMGSLVSTGVHEPELALVIGKRARNVPASEAYDYVVGYTILNDITARDLPQGEHPSQGSTVAKGLDTFAPCGPYLTLKQDLPNPHDPGLQYRAWLNGEEWEIPQNNTELMLFKVPQIIEYLSARITLRPGDIIATGVTQPVVPLRAGDVVEMTIGDLGTLRNPVESETTSPESR